MTCRVDSTLIAGACVVGARGLGVLGSVIRSTTATGAHGAGYLYNDWQAGDDDKEFRGLIVTPPDSGTLVAYEDGSFDFTAPADGSYSFTYRLFVDGADLGTATASVTIGAPVGAIPTNSTAPSITGSAVQGQTLAAITGAWANTPTSYAYRWLRGATAISGATGSTYVLQAGDVGSQIRVGVIATNATGSSAEALSAQTAVVTTSEVPVITPTVRQLMLREILRGVS